MRVFCDLIIMKFLILIKKCRVKFEYEKIMFFMIGDIIIEIVEEFFIMKKDEWLKVLVFK